jgi:hypothetical protein
MNLVDQAAQQARAMADAEASGQPKGASRIPLGPIPTLCGLGQAELPTPEPDPENQGQLRQVMKKHVVLSFSTPCGEQHYFLPPDQCKLLAEGIQQAATACETGMWLPGQG